MTAPPDYKQNVFLVLTIQVVLAVLFIVFGKYDPHHEMEKYPLFQDVHVMIFVGIGFLITFLKRYGFSSIGFNFLIGSVVIQWSILCLGFYNLTEDYKILVNLESLYQADIAAAVVLISLCVVLGQTSYLQLIVMAIIEIAAYSANSYLGFTVLKVVDAGGSVFVHTFGAYFGLAVCFVLNKKKQDASNENNLEGSSYSSDLFAMIGTIFLWVYWPSFNAIELSGDDQQRAVLNTYLSLASCCVTSFAVSQIFSHEHKFDMVHIQNSTLAGGVAVGACANLMIEPYGAIIIGIIAGTLSVYGYSKITPLIERVTGIHDTCGVHNLHGMPGVLSGLAGALMAGISSEQMYDKSLYEIYPAMASSTPQDNPEFNITGPGLDRTAGQQAGYQIIAVITTIAIAIVSGMITGAFLKLMSNPSSNNKFNDLPFWTLPDETESEPPKQVELANYDNPVFVNSLDKVS